MSQPAAELAVFDVHNQVRVDPAGAAGGGYRRRERRGGLLELGETLDERGALSLT